MEAKKLGLNIIIQNTKVMKLMTTDGMRFAVEAQQLENFNIFVHLTIKLCEDGDVRREVTTRTGEASAAFNGRFFFNNTGITCKTKPQLLQCTRHDMVTK